MTERKLGGQQPSPLKSQKKLGGLGTAPFNPGEVIKVEQGEQQTVDLPVAPPEKLTEAEKVELRKLGWQEGMNVPPILAELLHDRRGAIQEVKESQAVPEGSPVFVPPTAVDIDNLPPEKQQELSQLIQNFQQMAPTKVGQETSYHPSIAQAINQLQNMEFFDSGDEPAPETDLHAHHPEQDTDDGQQRGQQPEQKGQGQHQRPQREKCPHCQWPLDKEPDEPSSTDVQNFVQAVLGGKPFFKEYRFFGGRLRVVFRKLTVAESRLVSEQVQKEINARQITTRADRWAAVMAYRMAFAIVRLQQSEDVINCSALDERFKEPWARLEAIQAEEPWGDESVWRLLQKSYASFQKLIERIETMSRDQDF